MAARPRTSPTTCSRSWPCSSASPAGSGWERADAPGTGAAGRRPDQDEGASAMSSATDAGATAAPTGLAGLTRYQWRIFLVTWLGWALDSADFGLFAIVLRPALTELLGGAPSPAELGRVGGYLAMAGLL